MTIEAGAGADALTTDTSPSPLADDERHFAAAVIRAGAIG